MNVIRLIQWFIAGLLVIIAANYFKNSKFFSNDKPVITSSNNSSSIQAHNQAVLDSASATHQLNKANSTSGQPVIVGCMKTPTGCSCLDQKGKKVPATNSICQQNVRDSSGNQHKLMRNTQ